MRLPAVRIAVLPAVAVLLSGFLSPVQAQSSYLALGDSYAFGYQTLTTTPPIELSGGSNGDQGYISLFASYLAGHEGGLRPSVINLARVGETSVSFTSSASAPTAPANFNTRYAPGGFNQSQAALLNTTLASLTAAPKYVTIQLGGNDVLGPVFNDPASLPLALASLQTNYGLILASLRATLPDAEIYVLGYGNPFPGLPLNSPFNTPQSQLLASSATTQGNTLIRSLAQGIGAKYVDLSTIFTGQEAQLTNIQQLEVTGLPNYHPNAQGYQAIAGRLAEAAAPEPATLALILPCMGLAGVLARRRRTHRSRKSVG